MLVTIAIPTFNRARCLDECLASIFEAIRRADAQGAVEVAVSDNASTDDTESVAARYSQEGAPFTYRRQPENVGCHRNYRAAAELGRGRFVWIVGDDDRLSPAAVRHVLAALRGGSDAVISNVSVHSHDFQRVIKSHFIGIPHTVKFHDSNHLMATLGIHVGFISATVIDRERFLAVPYDDYMKYDLDGTCFMHAAYRVLQSCTDITFIGDPVVFNRAPGLGELIPDEGRRASSNEEHEEAEWVRFFAEGFPKTLRELGRYGYSRRATQRATTRLLLDYILPHLYYLRYTGRRVAALRTGYCRQTATVFSTWAVFLPLSFLPMWVLRPVHDIGKLLKRASSKSWRSAF